TNGSSQPLVALSISYGGYVTLTKAVKKNKHLTDLCPENYSLAGAEYEVVTGADGSGRVGTLTTTAAGTANTLKVQNAGRYYVKEVKAPKGYKLDRTVYTIDVVSGQTATVNVADEPLFDPLALKIQKRLADGADKNLPLEGAEYTVKYYKEYLTKEEIEAGATPFRTWVFKTDANGEFRIFDEWKIGGDELFKDEKGREQGLFGTYSFEETKAPRGLARTEGIISVQHIKQGQQADQVEVLKDVEDIEKPQTVSITLNKVDKETGKSEAQGHGSLAGAKYSVYRYNALEDKDEEVGEITTDEKGFGILEGLKPGLYKVKEILASAGYVIDSIIKEVRAGIKELNTANFNYDVKSEEQPITVKISKHSIDELGNKILVPGAVLEVKQGDKVIEEFKTTDTDKVLKALPKGKYTLHETEAPEGYFKAEDIEFTVEEKEDEQVVEMFDEPVPEIKTTANFDTGVKESLASEKVTVIDKVSYKKLVIGKEYEAKAKLVNRDNPAEVIATGSTKFTAEKSNGTVDVKLTFDASRLSGTTMVVFEDLYKNGKLLASHTDLTDEEQTVYIPNVKTKATDKIDDGKDMFAGDKQTIVDTVKYANLRVGQKYTVKGKLINKETGTPILDNGKEVTAEKTFTTEKATGEITLEFTFNAKALKGKTIVVFEDLHNDKVKVATHSDIEDKEQSIYVPEIKTTATYKDGKKISKQDKEVKIVDKVDYKNLTKGETYNLYGELIVKETGKVLAVADTKFTAEKSDGTVELEFTADTKGLAGKELVVFETLKRYTAETGKEKLVAEHKDIDDKGQTVKVMGYGRITMEFGGGSPSTSDNSNLALFITVLLISLSVFIYAKKSKSIDK
ncbi:MAG: VaFE repeat-containing surface-anchored protein, partial [Peptostreptococcaceae bacterium]|nr:VaFE repeat-containing surface-anchored protein [Peptostreptococcaceae bacterium]MDY5739239.1 VaFE repeat-containing surface-anchored protein [Anaerovoracaceae bacterium]